MLPWNNWFHCNGTLKGNWLRGDERGWRSRHHREHVEGDYRNRPPIHEHAAERQHSKNLMTAEPVVLASLDQRLEVCRLLTDALTFYRIEFEDLAVTSLHYHVLARFVPATGVAGLCDAHFLEDGRDPLPRYILGKCHSWTTRKFKERLRAQSPGTPVPGTGLFAPRPHCKPIEDERHFINARQYIRDHIEEGAAVYSIHVQSPGTPVPGM